LSFSISFQVWLLMISASCSVKHNLQNGVALRHEIFLLPQKALHTTTFSPTTPIP
jgi:hypothetical protein